MSDDAQLTPSLLKYKRFNLEDPMDSQKKSELV